MSIKQLHVQVSLSFIHNQGVQYFGSSKSFFLCNYFCTSTLFNFHRKPGKETRPQWWGWGVGARLLILLTSDKNFSRHFFLFVLQKQSDNKIFCNFHFSVKTKQQGQMLKLLAFRGFVIGYLLPSELSRWYQDTMFKGSVRVHVWTGVGGCTQNTDRRSWLAAKCENKTVSDTCQACQWRKQLFNLFGFSFLVQILNPQWRLSSF